MAGTHIAFQMGKMAQEEKSPKPIQIDIEWEKASPPNIRNTWVEKGLPVLGKTVGGAGLGALMGALVGGGHVGVRKLRRALSGGKKEGEEDIDVRGIMRRNILTGIGVGMGGGLGSGLREDLKLY